MKHRWAGVAGRLAAIPAPATLFVLALALFMWGALVVSPWFTGPVMLGCSPVFETALGFVYMVIGATRIYGVVRKSRKAMLAAPYGLMMGYLFLALLRIQVVGWFPLNWVPLALCAVVAGLCRLAILYGDKE